MFLFPGDAEVLIFVCAIVTFAGPLFDFVFGSRSSSVCVLTCWHLTVLLLVTEMMFANPEIKDKRTVMVSGVCKHVWGIL